jgi:hypothetical protein
MYKLNKNEPVFKKIEAMASQQQMSLKELLLSEQNLQIVSETLYEGLPKLVKWTMTKPKFLEFYSKNKESFVQALNLS